MSVVRRQEERHMNDSAFLTVLRPYFEAFAETDTSRRLQLFAEAMSPDA